MTWKRSIVSLFLGGGIVLIHWMFVDASDDFVVVRLYKGGYTEVRMGSVVPDGNGLAIPMPDGSREVVPLGGEIGFKVFRNGFPLSYWTSSRQLPMCTPNWQVPVRVTLNVIFFAGICLIVFSRLNMLKEHQDQ